ncbi:MAG: SIS domain-containing protein [Pseudolabrys sp.]|nr:SIS domain-containing protein [Pseudolabrys sp.]MDP2295730.1 SIS domain-containing protein [Pseudolabrys sp.]
MSFKSYCSESARIIEETAARLDDERLTAAIDLVTKAIVRRSAILVCGNGGSASDAMHITGELVGRFLKERSAFKAICLSSNSAVITAWSNDYSYDSVFARQVEAYAETGGVLIGLSTSGNSANVVEAFAVARKLGLNTIALTGEGGGKLAALSDVLLDVPSQSTPHIQQAHICIYHYLCEQVEVKCAGMLGISSESPACGA